MWLDIDNYKAKASASIETEAEIKRTTERACHSGQKINYFVLILTPDLTIRLFYTGTIVKFCK